MKRKKRLLVYANYFYPDVASTAQLYGDLCDGLKDDFDISVICSVPSYTGKIDDKYKKKRYYKENYNGIEIVRVGVPDFDKTNKKSRIKNVVAYFFRSIIATFKCKRPDVVFSLSTPPVLGGVLGVIGKRIAFMRFKRAKFIYNIQDFSPEQVVAVNYTKSSLIVKLMMLLDKHSCKVANEVIVVGSDMVDNMKKRFTKKNGKISKKMPKTVFINNWMDEKSVYPLNRDNPHVLEFKKRYGLSKKIVVMYSGNIGLYYDLENLIKVIAKFNDNENIVFPFIGEGAMKEKLENYVKENNLKNVVFIPYQKKEELVYSLNSADLLWVVNAKGIKGVSCPSKIYGALAVGKPVIGVLEEGSEVRNLIDKSNCGFVVSPLDYVGIEKILQEILLRTKEELDELGKNGYDYFLKNLLKETSINKYKQEINSLLSEKQ